jgi:hypothetical protein
MGQRTSLAAVNRHTFCTSQELNPYYPTARLSLHWLSYLRSYGKLTRITLYPYMHIMHSRVLISVKDKYLECRRVKLNFSGYPVMIYSKERGCWSTPCKIIFWRSLIAKVSEGYN